MVDHGHVNQWPEDHFDQLLPPHCHGDNVHVQLLARSAAVQDAFLHTSYAAYECDAPVASLQKEKHRKKVYEVVVLKNKIDMFCFSPLVYKSVEKKKTGSVVLSPKPIHFH